MNTPPQLIENDTLQVPNIAPNSSQLLFKVMDADLSVQEIQTELSQVSSIVGKLISLANSAWSNPVSPVTDLDAACARLGLTVVKAVTIGLICGKALDTSRCVNFDPIRYWSSSMIGSQAAAMLSGHFGVDAGTARTSGLLHNIGVLLLADRYPEQTSEALGSEGGDLTRDELIQEACGFGYWDAGSRLLQHWGLPEILVGSLQDPEWIENDQFIQASNLVRLAANISASVCNEQKLGNVASDQIDQRTLQTVFDEQLAGYQKTIEMTRMLFV